MKTSKQTKTTSVYRNQNVLIRAVFQRAGDTRKVLCVALDYAKRKHVALICDGNGDILKAAFPVENNPAGIDFLIKEVSATARRRKIPKNQIFFGGEDEAAYVANFTAALREKGYFVVRVSAYEAKENRENLIASTDTLDLLGIAKTLLARRARLTGETDCSNPVYHHLRELNRCRRGLVRQKTAASNRIHGLAEQLCPGFLNDSKSGLTAFSEASLALMQERLLLRIPLLRIPFFKPGLLEAEGPGKVGVQLLRIPFFKPGFLEAEGPGKVGVQNLHVDGSGVVRAGTDGSGDVWNNGEINFFVGGGLLSGTYTPIEAGATSGDWTGTGTFNAWGATWDALAHTLAVPPVEDGGSGVTGENVGGRRIGFGGGEATVGFALSAGVADISATPLAPPAIGGDPVLIAYEFTTTLSGVVSLLSFDVGYGHDLADLKTWHSEDGGASWSEWTPASRSYANGFVSFPVDDFSGFAVTTSGPVSPPTASEITVEHPLETGLNSGAATVDMGSGAIGSTGTPEIITVRNDGTSPLTGLAAGVSGPDAGDFAVDGSMLPATLAPGASGTLGLTATPSAAGTRNATLEITSNDADEDPFTIELTAEGVTPIAAAQEAYLKAGNAGASDQFGFSVAISGDTVVVGAPHEDGDESSSAIDPNDSESAAGAVYVFVRDGESWVQEAYLKASDPDPDDLFGVSVAVEGDTVVVGAPLEDGNAASTVLAPNNLAASAGAAYVFVRSGTIWSQQAYLKASNAGAGDRFGQSISLSGGTVLVGASLEDGDAGSTAAASNDNAPFAGAAYVFVRDGTTWSQEAYLKASNAETGDQFGDSLAIDGDTAVVGALGEDGDASSTLGASNNGADKAGAAYLFVRNGTAWSEVAYLKAENAGADDFFGRAVAVSGNTVIVGADGEDGDSGSTALLPNDNAPNAGAAYVFVRGDSGWAQEAYLKAPNARGYAVFGESVAVLENTVVIGARGEDGDAESSLSAPNTLAPSAGAAYVFERSGTAWNLEAYLKACNAGAGDLFGWSVALSGDLLVSGAHGEAGDAASTAAFPNENAISAGAAYVFDLRVEPKPEIVVEHQGERLVDGASSTVDFGLVAIGDSLSLDLVIRNIGTADLTGLSINPPPGPVTVEAEPPAVLPPGESVIVTLTFAPVTAGTWFELIYILSSDVDGSPFNVFACGEADAPMAGFEAMAGSAGLSGPDALPESEPFADGVSNVLKYALNMDLSGPDVSRMTPGGTGGLPGAELVEQDGQTYWQVQYVRRLGSGLIYIPKKSSTLLPGSFVPFSGAEFVESIDSQWERVTVNEPCNPDTTRRCFSYLEVTLP